MKNILMVLMSVLSILPSVGSAADITSVSLSTSSDLAVASSSVNFKVDYPGLGKNAVCSIELKLSAHTFATPRELQNVLVVEETFDNREMPIEYVDSKTGTMALQLGLYVTAFSISTRDGRPLREVLAENGIFDHDLTLHGQGCP